MSERAERWLIVTACVVLYAVAMGVLAFAIQAPTQWAHQQLVAAFGPLGALLVAAVPPIALLAWAAWRDRHLPPVDYTPPRWPRWVRVIGNTYLAVLGIGLVVAFTVIIARG